MSQNFRLLRQSEHIERSSDAEVNLSHTRLILQLAIGKMEWTLEGLLWRTVAYGATKQVDKLFAVVGLTSNLESEAGQLPMAISPDYSRSLADVGRDFTRHVINNSPTLLILSLINHDEESIARCPSESASWAYIPSTDLHSTLLAGGHVRTILNTHESAYFPTRRGHKVWSYSHPSVAPEKDRGTITLQGVEFGLVQAVPPRPAVPRAKLWHWIDFAYQVLHGDLKPRCNDMHGFLQNFFHTISAREDINGRDVKPVPEDVYAWLQEHPHDVAAASSSAQAFLGHYFGAQSRNGRTVGTGRRCPADGEMERDV